MRGVFELVVADFNSDDIDLDFLFSSANFRVKKVLVDGGFNRSAGLNKAAENADGLILFFVDADMVMPLDFVQTLNSKVETGVGYFPICYSLHEGKQYLINGNNRFSSSVNGWWRDTGWGMCAFRKEDFFRLGKWNERIGRTWGYEDEEMVERKGITVVRERCPGLFHLWHNDDEDFKMKYHVPIRGVVVRKKGTYLYRTGGVRLILKRNHVFELLRETVKKTGNNIKDNGFKIKTKVDGEVVRGWVFASHVRLEE